MKLFRAFLFLTMALVCTWRATPAVITGPIFLTYSNTPYTGTILFRPMSTPLPYTPNLITGGDFRVVPATNGVFSVELSPGNYRVTVGADKAFVIDVPTNAATYTLLERITNSLAWNSAISPRTNSYATANDTIEGVVRTYTTQAAPVVWTTNDTAVLGSELFTYKGSGSPEGVLTAPVGSEYHRTDGGASTSFYIKESGAGNTGWIPYGAPGAGGALSDGNKGGVIVSEAGTKWEINGDLPTSRKFETSATDLFTIGDSFTYGAGATSYTNTWPSTFAASIGLSATNLANGSFTISDANWSVFSGWTVTNATGPTSYIFKSPTTINDNQNWSVLIGFNDIRTGTTSASMFRKGLDHLLHWLAIPSDSKRTAQSPDASTGTWTPIPWSNGMGSIGAYSSSGTLTFSNVIGSDVYLGYIGWGTNFGGSLQISVDGVTITNFSTASVAYGNREYINGSDASIPDHNGPYGTGMIDFCPQLVRVTDLGFSSHTVVVTASSNPVYVLWCSGNGFPRSTKRGPNIFVGTIPRQYPWTSGGTDALHSAFNSQIASSINAAKVSRLRVAIAESSSKYAPLSHQGGDAVHPNDTGHAAIASAFAENFAQDLPSITSGQGISGGSFSGAGVFTSLSVSGTSSLVGNVTGNGRLLMLPTAGAGGTSHRFGSGSVAASGVQIIASDTSLDRGMTINGNSISVQVNSTASPANLSLGTSGQTVAVAGSATVAQTLGVTGQATFSDRLIVTPTATNGGYLHRFGVDGVASSGVTIQTGDTALDRSLTINGNSISAKVNSTGAGANLSLGTSGNNVAISGAATVAQALTVTGSAALNGGATLASTLTGSSGTQFPARFQYTVNQTGTAGSSGLSIEATTTALGSGSHRLISTTDDGSERFYVTTDGRIVAFSPNGTSGHLLRGVSATDSQILLQVAQTLDRRLTLNGNSINSSLADGTSPQTLALNDNTALVTVGGFLRTASGIQYGTSTQDRFGAGNPEGVVTENIGGTWRRTDGGSGTTFYVKESGTGNTGWVAYGAPGGSGVSITGTPSSGQAAEWTSGSAIQGVGVTGIGSYVKSDSSFIDNASLSNPKTDLLDFEGSTSGFVTMTVPAAAGTHTIKLPTTTGTANQLLKTDGSGQWGWVSPFNTGVAEATVASATTTDLGAVASDKVSITGTTTITGFGTVAAGTVREGRFTGVLTLTHNGTSLILPGAANMTTAVNDRFRAYSLGSGNWLVASYTKADGTAVVGGSGSVATDTIWDAAGDLVVGTGSDTASRFAAPTGFFPSMLYNGPDGVEWVNARTHYLFTEDWVYHGLVGYAGWGTGGNSGNISSEAQGNGLMGVHTSTSSTGTRALTPNSANLIFGEGKVVGQFRGKIPTLSTGSERFIVHVGFLDGEIGGTDGAYFRCTDNVSSGNWEACTESNNSITATDTGVAATTNYTDWTIVVNAAGNEVKFYINGTLVRTETNTIPTGASRATSFGFGIQKSIGTTQRDFYSDYIQVYKKFTTAR